ncbi:hypothetical protein BDZ89DRAFT_1256714 [Hymenopellis radicata]|nr:hypothetical protein BDZ89DRAFT_1256714 [Hymenopellis radicata]
MVGPLECCLDGHARPSIIEHFKSSPTSLAPSPGFFLSQPWSSRPHLPSHVHGSTMRLILSPTSPTSVTFRAAFVGEGRNVQNLDVTSSNEIICFTSESSAVLRRQSLLLTYSDDLTMLPSLMPAPPPLCFDAEEPWSLPGARDPYLPQFCRSQSHPAVLVYTWDDSDEQMEAFNKHVLTNVQAPSKADRFMSDFGLGEVETGTLVFMRPEGAADYRGDSPKLYFPDRFVWTLLKIASLAHDILGMSCLTMPCERSIEAYRRKFWALPRNSPMDRHKSNATESGRTPPGDDASTLA